MFEAGVPKRLGRVSFATGNLARAKYTAGNSVKVTLAVCATLLPATNAFADLKGFRAMPIKGSDKPIAACPTIDPIQSVAGVSYYVDKKGSVADPARAADNAKLVAPLKEFQTQVERLADAALNTGDKDALKCAAVLLKQWASANALQQTESLQAMAERNLAVGGIAIAVMKLRAAGGAIDPVVVEWIYSLSKQVLEWTEKQPPEKWANLDNWYTLFVMTGAVIKNDTAQFGKAYALAASAVGRISDDGLMPSELRRGSRALEYHYFGLTPLVMMAELAADNGRDLYGVNRGAIHRLIAHLVQISQDVSEMERLTGERQNVEGRPNSPAGLAWVIPYAARFPDRAPTGWLDRRSSLREPRLGGEVFNLFPPRGIKPLP